MMPSAQRNNVDYPEPTITVALSSCQVAYETLPGEKAARAFGFGSLHIAVAQDMRRGDMVVLAQRLHQIDQGLELGRSGLFQAEVANQGNTDAGCVHATGLAMRSWLLLYPSR
jgi:hypothetical protein